MIAFCLSLVSLIAINSCSSSKPSSSIKNMVARMQVKEPIEGVCDIDNVIAILPIPGNQQVKAQAPKTNEQIEQDLNTKVAFLKGKTDYEDKGMVSLIVNCKGELVKCSTSNKTKSEELDNQIVAVFAEMKTWTPGKVYEKTVDTAVLYSFTIKAGKITVN